jgi:hypothetical protein
MVGGERLSKLKLKRGLGDSLKGDLSDSKVKEAGERLEVVVKVSL